MAKTVFAALMQIPSAWLNKVFNPRHDGLDADGSAPRDSAADTGAADAYAVTFTPALTAHITGLPLSFLAAHTNTGASTFAPNGITPAVAIIDERGDTLTAGSIIANRIYTVIYDGTSYQLQARNYGAELTDDPSLFENVSLAAAVGSNALTVSLKTKAGADPSAGSPVRISFRHATLSNGTYNVRSITSALSVVLSSGSTLGFIANETGRIYLWALDNAGTVKMGISRTADIWREENLVTTVAEGGAGAADAANVLYSDAVYTNIPCRCLGYVEITTGATPGEWGSAPSKTQIMAPGVKKTGEIIQRQITVVSSVVNCNSAIPLDNTIPQNTEGVQVATITLSPTSAVNKLLIRFMGSGGSNGGTAMGAMAFFRDAGANAIGAVYLGATQTSQVNGQMITPANSTASTTIAVRVGAAPASRWINGDLAGNALFNGVAMSTLSVDEIVA